MSAHVVRTSRRSYFFLPDFPCFCDSALPAADLELALVRLSESVLDAAVAALLDVVSFGELL